MNEKSKIQISNSKQIPNIKFQRCAAGGGGWELGIWSLFGFWNLGLGVCRP
jgi:hypothetical protein